MEDVKKDVLNSSFGMGSNANLVKMGVSVVWVLVYPSAPLVVVETYKMSETTHASKFNAPMEPLNTEASASPAH